MYLSLSAPAVVKPKPPSATSIPAILKVMQDEWDAIMLHTFTQRQQLQTARQELSHALYQHDASCRVIARLTKEVTAAREALATLKPQAGIMATQHQQQISAQATADGAPTPMDTSTTTTTTTVGATEAVGLSTEVIDKLQEKATVLTKERKKRGRTVPEELATQEQLKTFRPLASHPGLHSASAPGILTLDIGGADHSRIITGGNDKTAVIFSRDTEQVVKVLKGHSKRVTLAVYHPEAEDVAITASPDASIRVWHIPTAQTTLLLRCHDQAVTGLSLHPTGDYVLSTSADRHWAFSDVRTGALLTKVMDPAGVGLTTAQFHPDGLIFGTGTEDAQVKIWDLKEQSNVANFPGHTGPITSIAFSENGYYLATAADDACVKLWDLRKLKNFKTIQLEDGHEVKDLCFDQSGSYLAVAGSDVRVYLCKQWQELKVFNDHTAMATGVRFGRNAQYLASTSMDRTLKLYGLD